MAEKSQPSNAITRSSNSRALLMLASVAVLLAVLKLASSFFVPLVIALFLAVLGYPMVRWMLQRRVPHFIAIMVTVAVMVSLLTGVLIFTTDLAVSFIRKVPEDLSALHSMADSVAQWLQKNGVVGAEDAVNKFFDAPDWRDFIGFARQAGVKDILNSVVGVGGTVAVYMSEVALVLVLMFFILSEAHGTTNRAIAVQQAGGPDFSRFLSAATEIQKYLGMKTIISAICGLLAGLWCWLFGLEYPALWGVLAFFLHFIPAVGALFAGILPCLVALVKHGPGDAAAIAVGYIAINFVIGNFIEPTLMGHRFGVSSLVIFLSVWFWGWMWGPVGAFLAVPLTIVMKVVLDNSVEFHWIGVAMSKKKVKKGEVVLETAPPPDESEMLGSGAATEPPH